MLEIHGGTKKWLRCTEKPHTRDKGRPADAVVVANKPSVRRHPGAHIALGVWLSICLSGQEMNSLHEWLSLHVLTPRKAMTLLKFFL